MEFWRVVTVFLLTVNWCTAQVPSIPETDVEHVGNRVTAPSILYKVDPEFSEEARAAGLEGTVVLSLMVDTSGTARDIKVLRSLGKGLDENAIAAVQKWKFAPGKRIDDGQPVNVRAQIEVSFSRRKDSVPHTEPSVLYKVDPKFSEEARAAGLEGTVVLSLIVDTSGTARDIKVLRSLGKGLDENAIAAVQKWKFAPGKRIDDGQPVNVRAQIEVSFSRRQN